MCAISDCIILLRTKTASESKQLKLLILNDWNNFCALYKGTGAKYVTIERVKKYLGIPENGGRDPVLDIIGAVQ